MLNVDPYEVREMCVFIYLRILDGGFRLLRMRNLMLGALCSTSMHHVVFHVVISSVFKVVF